MSRIDEDISVDLREIERLRSSPYADETSAAQIKRIETKVRMTRAMAKVANRRFKLMEFCSYYVDADARSATATPPSTARETYLKWFDGNALAGVNFVLELAFFELVASAEYFLFDAVRCVLTAYPENLSSTQVPLSDVMSRDKMEIVDRAIDKYLNEISYKRPDDYVKEVCRILRIATSDIERHWKYFVEIKARRDLAAHNDWIVNEQYVKKVPTDLRVNVNVGERLGIDFNYFLSASKACSDLESEITKQFAIAWK